MAKQRRKPATSTKTAKPRSTAKPAAARSKAAPKHKAVHHASARPSAKPAGKAATKAVHKAVARPHGHAPAKPVRPVRPAAPVPQAPVRRSTYAEAVTTYQRGLEALQGRRYRESADILKSVIALYPDETELHERALLYLRVCERQLAAAPPKPVTPEERVYAATLAMNNGAVDQALALLSAVAAEDPDNDHAAYMLGVASALRGRTEAALQHLSRAMALNPENRDLARKEPDLEALRRTDEMRRLLASPPAPLPRKEKRAPARGKGR